MKVIVRSNIIGAKNDVDLEALDGIVAFEYETSDANELIDKFERNYPEFRADTFEFVS